MKLKLSGIYLFDMLKTLFGYVLVQVSKYNLGDLVTLKSEKSSSLNHIF